jgi:rubredoxin
MLMRNTLDLPIYPTAEIRKKFQEIIHYRINDLDEWESSTINLIIESTKFERENPYDHVEGRAICPLCGNGSSDPYATGFTPTGLDRHNWGGKTLMGKMKVYYWKCQQCGLTFERRTSSEPKRCPMCADKGAKTFVEEKEIEDPRTPVQRRVDSIMNGIKFIKSKVDFWYGITAILPTDRGF